MRYQLGDLAATAGLAADTIRYYQSIGLLHRPAHEGRLAMYDDSHLDRLRLIRSMSAKGLPLKVIAMLLARGERAESDQALLLALEQETAAPRYGGAELAAALGIPRALVALAERSGLVDAFRNEDGAVRYSEADLRSARGALKLLHHGIPVRKLLPLAIRHDRAMRKTVDGAIGLFDDHVRKRGARGAEAGSDAVAEAFKELLPAVTALVAHHFQRMLVARALGRLKRNGEHQALEAANRAASELRFRLRLQ